MCTHKKYVTNPYTGERLLVPCGKCAACLQEKANKRTVRIKNHCSDDLTCLFVTLTYRNECVPYIRYTDLINCNKSYDFHHLLDDEYNFHLPLFRDCETRWVAKSQRDKKTGDIIRDVNGNLVKKICRKRSFFTHQISEVVVPFNDIDLSGQSFTFLRKRNDGAIGIIYYKDVQDYLKRVRITLKRKNYDFQISFFSCSEYGPSTCRPHFHLLVFVPKGYYEQTKDVLSACWSFDDYHRTRQNISRAKDAAAYVSSYVNCDTIVPDLFKNVRKIRPNHSMSKGFGTNKVSFSPTSILEKIRNRNLRYDCARVRNGQLVTDTLLLPKYVISRYFPRFTGFCRLTDDEVFRVALKPSSIGIYAKKCLLTHEQCRRIYVMLKNKQQLFFQYGISKVDCASAYSHVWNVYRSNILQDWYDSIKFTKDYFQAYDNIKDFYCGDVLSPTLDELMFHLPKNYNYETDYNKFDRCVYDSFEKECQYYSAIKTRKVRNDIFTSNINLNI